MATKKKTLIKPAQKKVDSFATANKASRSGQVPAGKVRFSVNLSESTHQKLRRAALQRSLDTDKHVTMGEIVADLVEKHL